MILRKKLIESLRFTVRHDYANPDVTLTLTFKDCRAIMYHLEGYKTLLNHLAMKKRSPNLDLGWMKQLLKDLQFVSPVIPRHLTREGGLIGATEEYLRAKKS